MSINKVLLEHKHTHSFHVVSLAVMEDLSGCSRGGKGCKATKTCYTKCWLTHALEECKVYTSLTSD